MERLDNEALERSSVVANSRMNRERGATGVNSYERDIWLNPILFLNQRLAESSEANWLDLCCGRGRALIDTAVELDKASAGDRVSLHGIDLVEPFDQIPSEIECLSLECSSLHDWTTSEHFDLITCVHGMHYIGDKLSLIERAISWLKPNGFFVCNLDLDNIRSDGGKSFRQRLIRSFRDNGLEYQSRRHVLSCEGRRSLSFGLRFNDANDQAGPNYSGQEAVDSYYQLFE